MACFIPFVTYGGAPVYGAEWAGTSSPAWVRTDAAANFADPDPAVANGTGSSPFDNIMPWSGMVKVEDAEAGTLVAIPKFYYKWTKTGSKLKLQITTDSFATRYGFHISPAHADRGDGNGERDVVYIGRYHCASDYKSKTGVLPKTNITRAQARNGIHALGSTIWQSDMRMRTTIWMLYLVEFANWNSQAKVGRGCGNGSGVQNVGASDALNYHTGTASVTLNTYGVGVEYRNIEGLWDNCYDWCDGYIGYGEKMYIIDNPSRFADGKTGASNAVQVGSMVKQDDTYQSIVSAFTPSVISGYEWVLIPSDKRGSISTYVTDRYTGGPADDYSDVETGCGLAQEDVSGLFRIGNDGTGKAFGSVGCRLMKLP